MNYAVKIVQNFWQKLNNIDKLRLNVISANKLIPTKMRTIEQQIFKFSELSTEIQNKVIDKYYQNEEYPFFDDDIKEFIKENDIYKYMSNLDINFSFGYSQSDFLHINSNFDLIQYIQDNYKLEQYKINAISEYIYKANISKFEIEIDYNYNKECNNIDNLLNSIIQDINILLKTLIYNTKKHGYSILEYRMSIDEFIEHSDINEYEYFSNGEMY